MEISSFPVERQTYHAEETYQAPDLSIGSPLLNKNQDSLEYQSLLKYINKHFDTASMLRLDQRFSGLKRRLDFSGHVETSQHSVSSMNSQSMSVFQDAQSFVTQSKFKKIKQNPEDVILTSHDKEQLNEYIQLPKFNKIIPHRQMYPTQSKEPKQQAQPNIKYQHGSIDKKENVQNFVAKKRTYQFEMFSEESMDFDSSSFLKESNGLKIFRNNNYQTQGQRFSLTFA